MGGSGKKVKDLDKPKSAKAPSSDPASAEVKKEKSKRLDKPVQQYSLVRLAGADLNGDRPVSKAILSIRGISWSLSNAVCLVGGFDPEKKLSEFSEAEVAKMEEIIKNPVKFGIPSFLINRKRDVETGADMHLTGSDLEVANRFDVQRFIDLKTYRGWRHMLGQPVRGQRTKAKFRQKGRVVGVLRKSVRIATGQTGAPTAGPAGAPPKKEEKK